MAYTLSMTDTCPICFTTFKNKYSLKTPCNHYFCLECIQKLDSDQCPICREILNLHSVFLSPDKPCGDVKYITSDFYFTQVPF